MPEERQSTRTHTLVFGVTGFPDALHPAERQILVPLTISATLDARRLKAPCEIPGLDVNWDDHVRLQRELTVEWRALESTTPKSPKGLTEYDFSVLHSIRLSTQFIVRRALLSQQPEAVWLPAECAEVSQPPGTREEMIAWLVYRVLREETEVLPRKYFTSLPMPPKQMPQPRQRRGVVGGVKEFAQRLRNEIHLPATFCSYRTVSFKANVDLAEASRTPMILQLPSQRTKSNVLVIAQQGKVRGLLARRLRDYRWCFLDHQEFERSITSLSRSDDEVHMAPPETDALTSINAFVASASVDFACRDSALESLVAGDWHALITDAQHDVTIRELARRAVQAGRAVAVVPEGAISYVDELADFGGSALFDDSTELTRFVLDEAQKRYWQSQGPINRDVFVSGFLGNTYGPHPVKRWVESWRLGRSMSGMAPAGRAMTAMLSFDAIPTIYELPRFGQPTSNELWRDLNVTLSALLDQGFRVLVKSRDAEVSRALRQLYADDAVFVSEQVPWQVMADRSDVVITRDSSIGWEAIARGKPVLIWNFSDYPSFAEVTLRGLSDQWVDIARSGEDVPLRTQGLLDRRERYAGRPPVSSRPEVVLNWLGRLKQPQNEMSQQM